MNTSQTLNITLFIPKYGTFDPITKVTTVDGIIEVNGAIEDMNSI